MVGSSTMLSINYMKSSYGIITEQDIKKISYKLDKDTRDQFKAFDGASGFIDTPEEFITAAYFSPVQIQITDASAAAAIEAELPHTDQTLAGKKLAAMWLKKRAERTESAESYLKAIEMIKAKTCITDAEITAYYTEAIALEIANIAREEFKALVGKLPVAITDRISAELIKPLINYYQNPSQENYDKLARHYTSIFRKAATDVKYAPLLATYTRMIESISNTDFSSKLIASEMAIYKTDIYTAEWTALNNLLSGK